MITYVTGWPPLQPLYRGKVTTVGPIFSRKLVGPWTPGGKKNESGPKTVWRTSTWAKHLVGNCGRLAAGDAAGTTAASCGRFVASATAGATPVSPNVADIAVTKPRTRAPDRFE